MAEHPRTDISELLPSSGPWDLYDAFRTGSGPWPYNDPLSSPWIPDPDEFPYGFQPQPPPPFLSNLVGAIFYWCYLYRD